MEKDIVIVGSGGAGLSAAITAAKSGLDVLVVEKTRYFGGTTALSGGGIWIPANSIAEREGLHDTPEAAAKYISGVVGDIVREDVLDTFVHSGREMLDFLLANSEVEFSINHAEPDYYQDVEGAVIKGRLLNPVNYDGRLLERDDLLAIRPPLQEFNAPMGFMVSFDDIPHLMSVGKNVASTVHVLKMVGRYAMDRLKYPRGTHLTMGNALIARMLRSARAAGVNLLNNAPMKRLVSENGRVVGIEIEHNGKTEVIRARKGVILASGGFSASLDWRRKYIPYPEHHVSFLPEGNTGDGLQSAIDLGAELEDGGQHGNAAFTIMSVYHKPDGTLGKYPHVYLDRTKPGCIAVNSEGKRFGNEAAVDLYKSMHDTGSVPAHLVCDHKFIKKYGLGLVLPGGLRLGKLLKAGYIIKGDTLEELARNIGADPANLAETVAKNNQYAKDGIDPEFHKGETLVDKALGDPSHGPNPCLGPIETGPFYAVKIFPGDGSTMLGLKVDGRTRVVNRETGQPIPGLYACGLDMNVLWRGREPAHGSYNGLGLTFGYVAARTAAGD
ncbi:MAG: FAD-dependent oxidoreductase [Porticoccaceae bacterium]|nr:FAD-dependent oxidoreductase [Porticoccaceae bacterium]MEA3300974.1 FAD-dependent oxidoreductase [Pseudomonadota bacterium]HLS98385.1 FAD-dependent oxidoreductase [Porticoccaceae bacterium]